jgi:hypothetical protein
VTAGCRRSRKLDDQYVPTDGVAEALEAEARRKENVPGRADAPVARVGEPTEARRPMGEKCERDAGRREADELRER